MQSSSAAAAYLAEEDTATNKDVLLVGTPSNLLAYDVDANRDIFFKGWRFCRYHHAAVSFTAPCAILTRRRPGRRECCGLWPHPWGGRPAGAGWRKLLLARYGLIAVLE